MNPSTSELCGLGSLKGKKKAENKEKKSREKMGKADRKGNWRSGEAPTLMGENEMGV